VLERMSGACTPNQLRLAHCILERVLAQPDRLSEHGPRTPSRRRCDVASAGSRQGVQ